MLRLICLLLLASAATACPSNAGQALLERNHKNLLECDSDTLRSFYNDNDCCIANIAECNYIEKAWWMRVNVLSHEPLCSYTLRHPQKMQHFKRVLFLKRIKNRIRNRRGNGSGALRARNESLSP